MMKYFSMFSGIGGFEYGIRNAYRSANRGSETDSQRNEGQGFQPQESEETSSEKRSVCECNNNIFDERPLCIGFSEIDKYAVSIYKKHFGGADGEGRYSGLSIQGQGEGVHGVTNTKEQLRSTTSNESRNGGHKAYGDCTKINWSEVEEFDCLVGGFPCQAFSIAGERGGFNDTRGTLFFEIARCLREKQPRLCVLENVKGLLSHDKGNTFLTIITTLDELGYDCEWQVLNSKNFGVPQNRERVFIIGHLRGTCGRKIFPIGCERREANRIQRKAKAEQERVSGEVSQGDRYDASFKNRGCRIRRLTPTECERLQGFPDGWTEYGIEGKISDTQRYKCLGNAVTTNVITAIFKAVFNEQFKRELGI